MTQTTDRDPHSEGQMAAAVAIYLNAVHPLSTTDRDEADIEFESALLQQGVIAPHEAIESIEPVDGDLLVILESQQLSVFRDGSVHVWDRVR